MKGKKSKIVWLYILIGIIVFTIGLYLIVAFTNIPILSDMRNIWIETAMTTADHQWLATKLFPKSVIDEVMSKKVEDTGKIGVTNIITNTPNGLNSGDNVDYNIGKLQANLNNIKESEQNSDSNVVEIPNEVIDIVNPIFSDEDEFGNKVVVNDKEQGIKIVEVKTSTYTGQIVFIDDPSRVFVADTDKKGQRGELILNYLDKYDAIVGINANGFADAEGKGLGGDIIGCSVAEGEYWGNHSFSNYTTIGFDTDNRLVVGKLDNPEDYNLRDAGQFKPALIIDGEVLIKGTAGWGMQPRTVVAQRADGVVMFLVVDGRQPGHSIGITMGEAAELLYQYGAVTAAACDGGSSSVLAYNGEIINSPSTPMETGRYLPNAFLVRRKQN